MLNASGQTEKNTAPVVYTVLAGQEKAPIAPTMYGIFFEDINMAADGGVYAELVKNRSFEFGIPLQGWSAHTKTAGQDTGKALNKYEALDNMVVVNRSPENPNNPRYLKVTLPAGDITYGIANEGFR